MEYFYTLPDLVGPNSLTITGEEFSHLTHVMRKAPGDSVRVVDGRGTAYDVTIQDFSDKSARCRITAKHVGLHEPVRKVVIGAALLKNGANFDYLVEKVTELGVAAIVPLLTERTIPRHARIDRWRKIALAAMKQSGRCLLPDVHALTPLEVYLHQAPADTARIIPYEKTEQPRLRDVAVKGGTAVYLCIGPEGGFSDGEMGRALSAGFQPVSLGPRRLRTETAAIVSAVLALGEA